MLEQTRLKNTTYEAFKAVQQEQPQAGSVIPAEEPVVNDPAALDPMRTAGSIIEPSAEVHLTPLIAVDVEPEPENQARLFVEEPIEEDPASLIIPDNGEAEISVAPTEIDPVNADLTAADKLESGEAFDAVVEMEVVEELSDVEELPIVEEIPFVEELQEAEVLLPVAVDEPITVEEEPTVTGIPDPVGSEPAILLAEAGSPNDEEPAYDGVKLKEWVNEFFATKTRMVATAFKGVAPRMEGEYIHVVIDTGMGLDHFNDVKREFSSFIREKTDGKIQGLVIDKGEVKGGDKRPYTDKDKLEYLMKKEPKLEDLLKKLDIRQP